MATILNGRLPVTLLVTVGLDHYGRPARFRPEAAASWARMVAAGMPVDVSDTYRDIARQQSYYDNPPNSVGLAAYPGTSTHGWGLAVDARGACLLWLTLHGAEYGWIRTIAKESWHFEYRESLDRHIPLPPPVVAEEDWFDMATKEELEDIIRRADFIRFRIAGKPNVLCEASMAAGTWRVYQTEAEIQSRYDVLTSRGWVIEDWPSPVVNTGAFGARVYNAWESKA